MLRVVLVDDEEIIREGLAAGFPWQEAGFEIVGMAEDGEEALEIVAKTRPDVVITDIKMPFVDGLEFIARIKPERPDLCIIIISGHDEFNYAQKALKLGAYDYILKPIDLDYLKVLLQSLQKDFADRKKKENEIYDLKERLSENLPLLREHFFRELAAGKVTAADLPVQAGNYQIDLRGYCSAAILQLDDYYPVTTDLNETERKAFHHAFSQLIRAQVESDPRVFVYDIQPVEFAVFATAESPEALQGEMTAIIAGIRSAVRKDYSVTVAVGAVKDSVLAFSESYREAAEALNYKFILGSNQDLYFQQVADKEPGLESLDCCQEAELMTAVKLGEAHLIRRHLGALIAGLREQGLSSRVYLRMVVSSIYLHTLQMMQQAACSPEEIYDKPLNVYQRIISQQTIDGLAKELEAVLVRVADIIQVKKGRKFFQTVVRAQEYLLKNYTRDDLSLEEVANAVHMSSCYFSLIFKQEAGTTFVDYLTKVRIEKAKELLLDSDSRSYEISYQVGYNNPTYFSTLFKKYVGVSPTEFRSHLLKSKPD